MPNKSMDEDEEVTKPNNAKPEYTGSVAAGINHDTGAVMTEEEMREERERKLEGARD